MNNENENVRDVAMDLEKIYLESPVDYGYVKGWIQCLLNNSVQKEKAQEEEKTSTLVKKTKSIKR